jgi:putative transposase
MQELRTQINSKSRSLWTPTDANTFNPIITNTWFGINEANNLSPTINNLLPVIDKQPQKSIHCKRINITLNDEQKTIMKRWLFAYIHMYNQTIKLLKTRTEKPNWLHLRTYHLKEIKNTIRQQSQHPNILKNTKIVAHTLDGAIKLACSNYKTSITNQRLNHIRHFRIHKWRFNRRYMVMDIEHQYFRQSTLCKRIFGTMEFTYDNELFDVNTLKSECKILYDSIYNSFVLLVPETTETKYIAPDHKTVALDPGLRTFMTGISQNNAIEIGSNIYSRISPLLATIDNINNVGSNKKKSKVTRRCRRKIDGLITELHWKTAKYLTDHYDQILIGDLSAKRITSNNALNGISDLNKRIAYALSFYKFRERLQFKCKQKNRTYELIDEHYTSKLCSMCGACKDDLGSAKVYNCSSCGLIIGRDINGARNIFMKSDSQ